MPRIPKPWFDNQTGVWTIDLDGTRIELVKGEPGERRSKTPPGTASMH